VKYIPTGLFAATVVVSSALGGGPLATHALANGSTSGSGFELFITSAVENGNGTVTLPLHRGTSNGQTVYYIVTDTSNGNVSSALGVNTAQKLANAANTAAVQKVSFNADGSVNFPASVHFGLGRKLVAGSPGAFPPSVAQPGAVGEAGYSPLIQLPDGTVENAPQIANASGQADKVVSLDIAHMKVTYKETNGFQENGSVHYLSTESSSMVAAAIEDLTYAPALDNAPSVGDDSTASARATLVTFANGQTGAGNPNRQGLSSAIADNLDALNLLRWNPSQGRYAPLWDVNVGVWSDAAVANGQNTRQTAVSTAQEDLAQAGLITGPGGARFGASGFIVNCPIISRSGSIVAFP
jgi:hypothetical protein